MSPLSKRGHVRALQNDSALLAAAIAVREGKIVAVKGLGGFHLMADVRNDQAVRLLRERKHREEKPFALMFPSLATIKAVCEISPLEERLLCSPESPVVLLKKIGNRQLRPGASTRKLSVSAIGNCVAPGNPNLGIMLPYTPLHHLLMAELGFPVVATSGNLGDEPICTDEREALERLGGIADMFLIHNRPIVRHVDDSIVRVMLDRELVLRRARGYAPLPVELSVGADVRRLKFQNGDESEPPYVGSYKTVLAVGAHLKSVVALSIGPQVFLSQHIGDLETEQANHAFRRVIADFETLYGAKPQIVAADLHPDYLSTKYANEISMDGQQPGPTRIVRVQHHIAHVLSCMAENEITPPVLGISWDGTGYGLDGTIWGGEFFLVTDKTVKRIAHLRPFRLPGGELAIKEPRRAAIGLLCEISGDAVFKRNDLAPITAFSQTELAALKMMLAKKLNSPVTTSIGRLFDAVASLVNLRQQMRFEGQAAMELEFSLDGIETDECYTLSLVTRHSSLVSDWSPMIEAILADVKAGVSAGKISAKFHNALVEAIIAVAKQVGESRVVLSGGCFQNRYLTERAVRRLRAERFRPYWHQRVPPNDGGIALGQVIAALRQTD